MLRMLRGTSDTVLVTWQTIGAAVIAGLFSLDRRIERQQVRLVGDLGDAGDDPIDAARLLIEGGELGVDAAASVADIAHDLFHPPQPCLSVIRQARGLRRHRGHRGHGFDQLAGRCGNLFRSGADLGGGGGDFGSGRLLLVRGGANLADTAIDAQRRALYLADQLAQLAVHARESRRQGAYFVFARFQIQGHRQVAGCHPIGGGHHLLERPPDIPQDGKADQRSAQQA